jgi:ABC-type transporter Mla maintaining outer membrane lipid asymmetry permease subunit MlaE
LRSPSLQRFGSESALGVAVALGLVRELDPVMTAILFAGRAVYEGFHAEPTARGVALATARTVVGSTVFTLILDYLLTAAFI